MNDITRIANALEKIANDGISVKTETVTVYEYVTKYSNIKKLDLSARSFNCLRHKGLVSIQDVVCDYENDTLKDTRNLGRKGYEEVVEKLTVLGFIKRGEKNET